MSSSNAFQNLPSLLDVPGAPGFLEDVAVAVNKTLSRFCFEIQFQDYMFFYNLNKYIHTEEKVLNFMQSDRTILCEFNVGLWNKSLISAINSLAVARYPHCTIIQKFINYLLNAHLYTDFGLLEELFYKLLLLNPPRSEMSYYYYSILCDSYITLNGKHVEEKGLFDCLLEALITCLSRPEHSEFNEDITPNEILGDITENFYNTNLNPSSSILRKEYVTYFEDLSWNEKMKRCLCALNFVYNILETDFAFWLNSKEPKFYSSSKGNRPLMSHLLWPEKRDLGLSNSRVQMIIKMFLLGSKLENSNFSHLCVIKKILNLLAEIFRFCDRVEEKKYPYLGTRSNDLARELSLKLFELFQERSLNKREFSKVIDVIWSLKPPWFRMLLCSHFLKYITGYQCSPELSKAHDLLEHIDNVTKIKKEKMSTSSTFLESKKIKKLRNFKNINIKRKGKTLLHLACETNNADEVKALLTFPELNVNATDRDGWTALHVATQRGNADCVRELLFSQMSENSQKSANSRVRGPEGSTPLMCAVKEGRTEICRLLLEHSGSILLEDVNEFNQAALELSKSEKITRMLNYYKENATPTTTGIGRTNPSHFIEVEFDEKYHEIVIRLCVEMIQSYFCTHRTLDIYQSVKKNQKNSSYLKNSRDVEINPEWDYYRFHQDISCNINKLEELCFKLVKVPEFKTSHELLTKVLLKNSLL